MRILCYFQNEIIIDQHNYQEIIKDLIDQHNSVIFPDPLHCQVSLNLEMLLSMLVKCDNIQHQIVFLYLGSTYNI